MECGKAMRERGRLLERAGEMGKRLSNDGDVGGKIDTGVG